MDGIDSTNLTKFIGDEKLRLLGQKKFACDTQKRQNVTKILAVFLGAVMGFVNGLFGAGGGMLAVPVLLWLFGLNAKRAHATAILVILPLCVASAVIYLVKGGGDLGVYLPTTFGVVIGGLIGAYALKKCSNQTLQFVFYSLMLLAGVKMIS